MRRPSGAIPPTWVECTLSDVVEYGTNERAEPAQILEDTWILELEDIEKDTSRLLRRVRTPDRQPKSTKNRFRRGDILYGKLRPYLNKVLQADEDGCCSTEIMPVRPPSELDSTFVLHWLRSPQFSHYVNSVSHGLTMPRLGTAAARRAPFVLAPAAEQRRISEKLRILLSRADRCRSHLSRVPSLMSRLRLAILTYATSGELTVDWRSQHQVSGGWKTVSLSEVASGFSYGSAAKSAESGEVPVLRMGNIQDGHIDWSDLVYTSNPSEINKYSLEPGDVLFNRTNSPELVGKTAVYHGEREAIYAGYLIRVRCQGSVLPDFLSYSLNSSQGREYCQRVKSDGVSQSNINAKKLASYQFALPTLAEQHEITARVERLLNGVNELEARYKTVRLAVNQFVPALLALAYRGELVPQDPQDEPASRLLDRIKFARAAVAPIAREPQQFSPIPRAPRERSAMTKSRSDADVYHQPYLARLLRETVQPATVDGLFRRAGLSVSDFYKQLAWEVDQKFINDSRDYLEALQ